MTNIGINIPCATLNSLTDMIDVPTNDGGSFVSISRVGVEQLAELFEMEDLLRRTEEE